MTMTTLFLGDLNVEGLPGWCRVGALVRLRGRAWESTLNWTRPATRREGQFQRRDGRCPQASRTPRLPRRLELHPATTPPSGHTGVIMQQ